MAKIPLFLSYSKDDAHWLQLMSDHLSPLERNGLIETWDDRKLPAGDRTSWEEVLLPKLRQAGIIVILYSPSFARTDYCQKELQIALERKRNSDAKVFIIRVRPGVVQDDVFEFQVLPPKGRAVSDEPNPDRALEEIIQQICKEIAPARAAATVNRAMDELPFLYNRSDQEEALDKLIVSRQDGLNRPLAFIVSGADYEEHVAFHQRMLADFLPKQLRLEPADMRLMDLPRQPGEASFSIRRALEFPGKPEQRVRALPKGLSYLMTTIYPQWKPDRQAPIVREILDYWSGFPDLPASKAICVAVSIEWTSGGPSKEALNDLFPPSDYPKLRFSVLPDLRSPDMSSASAWVGHSQVKKSYNPAFRPILLREVRELFPTPETVIPMRELHPKLLDSLRARA